MRLALLGLIAFAAPAFSGDVAVTIRGTVSQDNYMFGPFQSLQLGDAVTIQFDVDVPGNSVVAGQLSEYTIDLTTYTMSGPSGSLSGLPGAGTVASVSNDNGGVDGFGFGGGLSNGDFLNCEFDASVAFWGSDDITQLGGVYAVAGVATSIDFRASGAGGFMRFDLDTLEIAGSTIGTPYCVANANSTGAPSTIYASGSAAVSANDFTLHADGLPAGSTAFFIDSQVQGFVTNPNGSVGNICLAGMIGRFVGPGQIQSSGATGSISLTVDLTQIPTPTGLVPAVGGETWNFQAWHRDTGPAGVAVSNFTPGLEVLFL